MATCLQDNFFALFMKFLQHAMEQYPQGSQEKFEHLLIVPWRDGGEEQASIPQHSFRMTLCMQHTHALHAKCCATLKVCP